MRAFFLSCLLFAATFTAIAHAALQVATDGVKISQVAIPVAMDNAIYQAVVIEITFNEPIFLHTTLANLTVPTPFIDLFDEHPSTDDEGASKLMLAGGFATLTCGSSTFETIGNMDNGPPDFAILAPPTAEPAYSFIRQMSGDVPTQGNDTWLTNRVSFLLLINSGGGGGGQDAFQTYANIDAFVACNPTLNFIDGHGSPSGVRTASLVDEDDVPFVASVALADGLITDSNSECTFDAFVDFQREFNDIMTLFKNVHSKRESKQVQWRLSALLTKRVYRDCNNKFASFFNYETATTTLHDVRGCFSPTASVAFATDPCCNRTLANSMCCVPKASTTFEYLKVQSFRSDALGQCANPEVIQFLLEDYVTATRNADAFGEALSKPQDDANAYQTKAAFQQECNTKIFNQKCVVDTDCVYGDPPMCGQQGFCQVDWTRQTEYLIPCYIADMPADIRAEIMRRKQVPIYSDPVAQAAAFEAALSDTILSQGCVGQKAHEFQARWDQENQVPIPANLTGCLLEQGCNWDTWTNDTPEKCVGAGVIAARGPNVCGQSQGTSFRDYARQPQCRINTANDNATCVTAGGTFVKVDPWNSACLNLTARTSGDCSGLGRSFMHGVWFDSTECAVGACNVPSLSGEPRTEEACSEVSICNQPCPTNEQPWAQCTSNSACLAAGRCNDDEFMFCTSTNGQAPVCAAAACLERFTLDEHGQRSQCNMQLENPWSRMGCVHREISTENACASAGYEWIAKATTEEECAAHGSGCVPKNNWGQTNGMTQAECNKCSGSFADIYQWIPGRLSPSRILELEWTPRAWGSVNQVVETIDFMKVNQLIEDAISAQQAQFALNTMVQMYVRPMQSMKAVICDCMGDNENCLEYIPTTFLDTTCTQDPNTENSCAGLTFNSVIADGSTVSPVSMYRTPVGAFVAIASAVSTRRRLLTVGPTLEIVKNAGDFVVGQLIGDGVTFEGVPTVNQTESIICLNRSLTLPVLNPLWTEPDFVYEVSTGVVSAPLNFVVNVTGVEYCTSLTLTNETVKYFPVLRYITWASVNSTLQIAHTESSRSWWDPKMPYMPLWGWLLSSVGVLALLGLLFHTQCCANCRAKAAGYSKGAEA